jgi:signal transduction histidine kinase
VNFSATILPFVLIIFSIAIGVVLLNLHFQKNLYKQKIQQEELNTQHQNELLTSSINVQEEERKRIAQDLHDELGATLSIIRMHLKVLEELPKADDKLPEHIRNVRQLTETALTSTRTISHQLMPPQLEKYGLVKTLETVINQINCTGNVLIHFNVSNTEKVINWNINLGLYRILMELINNTIKHAQASDIFININYIVNTIECTYTDNGSGIVTELQNNGLGLKSIEGRITSLNGTIAWGNKKEEKGFFASMKIPL